MLCGFMQNHAGPNNMCKKKRKTKRRGLHLSQNLLFWANQIGSLQKSKVELVRLPQLINMKQNKYPQFIMEVGCSLQAGQKWWQTLLEREISCSQWEGPSMHPSCLAFSNWVVGGFFFIFPWFPNVFSLSSLQVPNGLVWSHTWIRWCKRTVLQWIPEGWKFYNIYYLNLLRNLNQWKMYKKFQK